MTTEEKIKQLELENENLRLRLEGISSKHRAWDFDGLWVLLPVMGMITGIVYYLF